MPVGVRSEGVGRGGAVDGLARLDSRQAHPVHVTIFKVLVPACGTWGLAPRQAQNLRVSEHISLSASR